MLDQNTIDRIIDAANIVDVVSEYVSLRRAGANYKGLCPFHDDKTPSFHVSPAKGICKCFACGEGGNAVHFIMKIEQLSYVEALKWLAKKYGIEVEEKELTPEQRQQLNEREAMFNINEWASQYYHDILKNDIDGRTIGLAYFHNRGFRDDIIEKFRLGFSIDQWEALSKEAKRKGYNPEYLIKTGLCYKKDDGRITDRYRGRVMFPWFNVSGKIIAFGGRVLDTRTKGVSQKYINSPESDIFSKRRELYGLFQAKKQIAKEDRVYMVEGYTDVISMHQCGIENVVANSGTALTQAQIRLLHRYTNNITLLYDGDEAGIHAALRGTDMFLAEGMNVKILLLPDGDDPDSFARKHNASEFKAYVEEKQTDFILFKTNLLLQDAGRDPQKRAQLTLSIVYSISVIPDEILRAAYVHECAELLQQDEAMLLRKVVENKQAALEQLRKQQEIERERQERLANNPETTEEPTGADTPITQESPTEEQPTTPQETPSRWLPPHDGGNTRQSVEPPSASRFHGIERMMMSLIVRYGEQNILTEDAEGNPLQLPLINYVYEDLSADELSLHTPIYSKMLNEAILHITDPDFQSSRYFLNNPDLDISREAANLMTDRYQLSKGQHMLSEQELMPEYITHLLLDYKFLVIDDEMKKCQQDMNDPLLCTDAMHKYMQLSNIQRQLGKRLGDRIIMN
ncbi:MAG: DNA primase [Bacteroidaceae bacterium]|nr:DNA primase [Bacteroidaceae bacterium]